MIATEFINRCNSRRMEAIKRFQETPDSMNATEFLSFLESRDDEPLAQFLESHDSMNPISLEDAREVLAYFGSYKCLPALLGMVGRVEDADWLRLLGEEWSRFDNVGHYTDELIWDSPLRDAGTIPEMMTPEELAAFDELPDEVTIYRGCYNNNKWGLSWSLNKAVAERFPTIRRYCQSGQPILVTAQVKKSNIMALKLDRDEDEVITHRPKCISTKHIRVMTLPTGEVVAFTR